MSSDRERVSTDLKQQYRAVVFQQGRVTLAADKNEAQDIASEVLRADVDDIVGPVGTPDDGYAISPIKAGSTDFTIGKGTMYLGGERLELLENITYFGQKDGEWLDFPDKNGHPGNTQAWLLVREQEIGAVEDPNLLEVALGGPDTAQRTRFVQRVLSEPVKAADCPTAWKQVLDDWNKNGYDFDPKLMRFLPFARLQVTLDLPPASPDPCEPAPQGGYLGADNQCVRVMVTAFDATTGTAKIVWAFDNASHLFKVVLQNDNVTFKLGAPPVDAFHWPRAGQAVELLRSAVRLADGNTMAQDHGQIGQLAGDYNADQRTVQLTAALADPPLTPNMSDPPLFMRLWEQQLDATLGKPVLLGDTGLQVTLTTEGNNAVAPGVFWVFAVRPTTPQEIYPHRYLAAAQPPEGPRMWGCPLAVLQWERETLTVTADCRQPFDNLVELTKHKNGCCEFTVGKRGTYPDLTKAFADIAAKKMNSVGLCLLPDPPVHKLNGLIKLHHEPQMRVEINGSGPMTVLEIEGGGLDVIGIRAFALEKLHIRLMDEASQVRVQHCESLEVLRTRIDRIWAIQTVPMFDSGSNRDVRIDDCVFDAGHAMYTEFVANLGAASPLAAPLFAIELLREPQKDQQKEATRRLTPITKLTQSERANLINATKATMAKQGFEKSLYGQPMGQWISMIEHAGNATDAGVPELTKQLFEILNQFSRLRLLHPGVGIVLDHVGNNWLESSEFRCTASFTGVPGKKPAFSAFSDITKSFKETLVVTPNHQVTHLSKCTFDSLTYGDSLVKFLGERHKPRDPFYAPTSLVVEGCLFRLSPSFFFGAQVSMTNNLFAPTRVGAAWVLSQQFCPVANSSESETAIHYFAKNSVEPFKPVNVIGLQAE